MSHSRASAGVALALAFIANPSFAAEFYVDPAAASASGTGTAQDPWQTLESVVQAGRFGSAIKAGDTVWLRSGYHGEFVVSGGSYATPITIAAAPGATPRLRRVSLSGTQGWIVKGLSISPSHAATYQKATMVQISGSSSNITIENNLLFSIDDASGWSAADWDQLSANGIQAGGTNITLRGNTVKNSNFGISVDASDSLVERNVVDSFAGDGLRGLGNRTTFQYNVVKNCYDVNANHDDGFQSWSTGTGGVGTGEVVGVVLRGNLILNYEDPNQPFRGSLQGIGCFDGTYVDWVVENNVVITDHWHGITFLGARNVRVVNNTVIDRNDVSPGPPWIQIGNHKNGTAPSGCLVRNNLTTDLNNATSGVTEDHNLIVTDLTALFVDAPAFDLHLVPGAAAAIDVGSPDQAPAGDIEGIPRPQGDGFDLGAYEWHDGSVQPDGGLGSGGSGGGSGGSSGAVGSGGSTGDGGSGALTSGGTTGSGGNATGGGSGSSGSSGSSSGSSGTSGSGGNTAGDPGSGGAGNDAGCSCRFAGDARGGRSLAALVFALLMFQRKRSARTSLKKTHAS